MRGIFFVLSLLLTFQIAFACNSDCYQCHSDIPKDREHKVLNTCTNCHPTHSESAFNSKCGADCFECHSIKKVMELSDAHKVLERCIGCHKKLENSEANDLYNRLLN